MADGGTYTLSQQETAAIVAAAAPAFWPWPSGENQADHPFAARVPVRQIFDEVGAYSASFPLNCALVWSLHVLSCLSLACGHSRVCRSLLNGSWGVL